MKGVCGELDLTIESKNNKTILRNAYFTNPFKIAKPFYNDNDEMIIYMMNSSPGILEGDNYNINIDVKENSNCYITGQSYTKVFKMREHKAKQSLNIKIAKGASLKYFPLPLMLFKDSNFESITEVNIEQGGTFIWGDIISCGRLAMGEEFLFKRYYSRLEVTYNNDIVFLDNILMEPEKLKVNTIGCYEEYTHQGTLYICSEKIQGLKDRVFSMLEEEKSIAFGVTDVSNGMLLRILGRGAEQINNIFKDVGELINNIKKDCTIRRVSLLFKQFDK